VGKGAKIAIGCFAVLLLGAVVLTVGLGFGAYWLKGKAQQYTGSIAKGAEELAKYEEKANSNTFTPPSDGSFTEDRLLKFLEVRKAVYAVYEAHRADIESIKAKKQPDLSDAMKLPGLLADIKLAQEKAQAQVGMSDGEYLFMVQALYHAGLNSEMQKQTGRTVPQTLDEAAEQSRKVLEEAARQAGSGTTAADADSQIDQAQRSLSSLGAPQSNIDLYRKHQAEIQKYAMEGLGMIGL
jgi:hypothetical protein